MLEEGGACAPHAGSAIFWNRRAMAPGFPELAAHPCARQYPQGCSALQGRRTDTAGEEATVIVSARAIFRPAPPSSTPCWRAMGVDLVDTDLVERSKRIYMRTTAGLRRVDVIYKRTDDEFLDPEVFRPDYECRGARAGALDPRRERGGRQRHRQRHRGRQAHLHLCAGSDPLLSLKNNPANVDTWRLEDRSPWKRCWTGSTSWWSSRSTAPEARASVSGPRLPRGAEVLREHLQPDDPRGRGPPVVQLSTVPTPGSRRGPSQRHVPTLGPFSR